MQVSLLSCLDIAKGLAPPSRSKNMSHSGFDEDEHRVASPSSFRRKPEPRNVKPRSLDSCIRGNAGALWAVVNLPRLQAIRF